MGLIDDDGSPTERLKPLVSAKGEQRRELFGEIMSEAFGFVLLDSFELQSATYAQLQERFNNTFQLTAGVSRKCIKFFIALASDAGISISPFITKRFRSAQTSKGTKTAMRRTGIRTNRNLAIPHHVEEIPDGLLAKFPTFDPSWSDEVKLKWFEAFDKLLMRSSAKDNK